MIIPQLSIRCTTENIGVCSYLALKNTAVVSILVHVFWFMYLCISLGHILRSKIAGSKSMSMVSFGRH